MSKIRFSFVTLNGGKNGLVAEMDFPLIAFGQILQIFFGELIFQATDSFTPAHQHEPIFIIL